MVEHIKSALEPLLLPFLMPFMAHERVWVVYLLSSLLVAYAVFRWLGGQRSVTAFLAYVFPKALYTHPSAKIDFIYFVLNKAAFAVFFAPFVLGTALVTQAASDALTVVLGAPGAGLGNPAWLVLPYAILVMLGIDFGLFLSHYLQHRIPLLWEFHKVHHSAEVLTPITVYRMHPVDDLLAGSLAALFSGMVHGVFVHIGGGTVDYWTVQGLNIGFFIFYMTGYHLRHSHIWLSYAPGWSHILISPAQHQIHHSSEERHFDRNMGFIFAFWDWLAGTLYVPKAKETFPLGLSGGEHREFDSVAKLYFLPFVKIARKWRKLPI